MEKEKRNNIFLGIFVVLGISLFITGIYFVGAKKNMFSSTFPVIAIFTDVNGLENGDNIRFRGLNIGTVEKIEVSDDSAVIVTMVLEKNLKSYINKNVVASIGTDGLMGNKIVTLKNGTSASLSIAEGDTIQTLHPIETDEIFRSLGATAKSIAVIADNLKSVTAKIDGSKGLWDLLGDTALTQNLNQAIVAIKMTGNRSALVVGDLSNITKHIEEGKGSFGALLMDTTLASNIKQSIVNIHVLSNKMALISGDLSNVSAKLKDGNGSVGTLLMDTTFINNLNKSMENIKNGSQGLDEDMEALKHSFLLRKYFKKKEKEKPGTVLKK